MSQANLDKLQSLIQGQQDTMNAYVKAPGSVILLKEWDRATDDLRDFLDFNAPAILEDLTRLNKYYEEDLGW